MGGVGVSILLDFLDVNRKYIQNSRIVLLFDKSME